jgi:uncharacterized phage-associated protein
MISEQLDKVQSTIINVYRGLFGESITPIKLQKLCYYAQGYALAEDSELFPEDFQAWVQGPTIPNLYDKYKECFLIREEVGESDVTILEYITDIVSAYGRYDETILTTMACRQIPWLEARGNIDTLQGSTSLISKESLKNFFANKLKEISYVLP